MTSHAMMNNASPIQRLAAALVVMSFVLLTGCTDSLLTEAPEKSSASPGVHNTSSFSETDLETDLETDSTDFESDPSWPEPQRVLERF